MQITIYTSTSKNVYHILRYFLTTFENLLFCTKVYGCSLSKYFMIYDEQEKENLYMANTISKSSRLPEKIQYQKYVFNREH